MDNFIATESLIIELLLAASLVAIAVRRLRAPYTVGLVIAGLLITFHKPVHFELTPELILGLFVPPLVFEAGLHIELKRLRENLVPILVLAVPGVLLTTLVVGLVVSIGLNRSIGSGLVFGALISATDPVAVVAFFRKTSAPRRLAVLVEGESLFNDGIAIVIFNLALAGVIAASGSPSPLAAPGFVGAVIAFIRVSVGGFAIGLGLGWLTSRVIAQLDDYLIETTLTVALAFGAYVVAERLGVSGVLAVVAAGLVNGNIGPRGMSPTTRIVVFNFWECLAFVVNSLVFLMIGLDVNLPQLSSRPRPILTAVVAVLAGRAAAVYGLSWLLSRKRYALPMPYRHVLFWGGLRGAISLALVLSLPAAFGDRDLFRVMALGVVLFTLLGQATTIPVLIRRLGLIKHDEAELEYERRQGRLAAARAARDRLRRMFEEGVISESAWNQLEPEMESRVRASQEAQHALLIERPVLQAEEVGDARREGFRAQRAALLDLLGGGLISEEVYAQLVTEVDLELGGLSRAGVERPSTD
jgi:CPA1 family monovalent cation:H+ antiporter